MFDSEVVEVPPVWQANPIPLIIVAVSVILMIIITFFFVRKELINEKNK